MKKNVLLLILLVVLTSCSVGLDLFPVRGPLAESGNYKVIKAKALNVTSNSGKCYATLSDGEYCKGRWSSTSGVRGSYNNHSLMVDYGQEIGLHPRGNENRGYAMLVGDKGTSLEIEFLTGAGTAHGFGIAKDSKGNIYKVIF
jgi:hypothetical protein